MNYVSAVQLLLAIYKIWSKVWIISIHIHNFSKLDKFDLVRFFDRNISRFGWFAPSRTINSSLEVLDHWRSLQAFERVQVKGVGKNEN